MRFFNSVEIVGVQLVKNYYIGKIDDLFENSLKIYQNLLINTQNNP